MVSELHKKHVKHIQKSTKVDKSRQKNESRQKSTEVDKSRQKSTTHFRDFENAKGTSHPTGGGGGESRQKSTKVDNPKTVVDFCRLLQLTTRSPGSRRRRAVQPRSGRVYLWRLLLQSRRVEASTCRKVDASRRLLVEK